MDYDLSIYPRLPVWVVLNVHIHCDSIHAVFREAQSSCHAVLQVLLFKVYLVGSFKALLRLICYYRSTLLTKL